MGCSECGSALWTIPRGRAQRSIFGSGASSRGSRYPNTTKYSKRPDERMRSQLVPLSRPVCRADWRKSARLSPTAPEFTAVTDSPLEGSGFELVVPREMDGGFEASSELGEHPRRGVYH